MKKDEMFFYEIVFLDIIYNTYRYFDSFYNLYFRYQKYQ